MDHILKAHLNSIKIMEHTGDLQTAYEKQTTGFNRYFVLSPQWEKNRFFRNQNSTLLILNLEINELIQVP